MSNRTKRWMRGVVKTHQGDLQRYATRLVHEADVARDVVQDTFLRLWEVGQIDDPEHLRRWLFVVCRNRCTDAVRRQRTAQARANVANTTAAPQPGPQHHVEQRQLAARLERQLTSLSQRERDVVLLKVRDGLSYREIGTTLGLSESNVGVILHRALRSLRKGWPTSKRPSGNSSRHHIKAASVSTRSESTAPAVASPLDTHLSSAVSVRTGRRTS